MGLFLQWSALCAVILYDDYLTKWVKNEIRQNGRYSQYDSRSGYLRHVDNDIDGDGLMTIAEYMQNILENLKNPSILAEMNYCENDRDCGYRSALRFLCIEQSDDTDDIANSVIYRNQPPQIKKPVYQQAFAF